MKEIEKDNERVRSGICTCLRVEKERVRRKEREPESKRVGEREDMKREKVRTWN